jgi:hypothetical protein
MKNQSIHESVFESMKYYGSYTPKARLPSQEEWPREGGDLRGGNSVEVDASQAQADRLLTELTRFSLTREGGLDALDLHKSING